MIPYKSYYLPRATKEIPHCKNHSSLNAMCWEEAEISDILAQDIKF